MEKKVQNNEKKMRKLKLSERYLLDKLALLQKSYRGKTNKKILRMRKNAVCGVWFDPKKLMRVEKENRPSIKKGPMYKQIGLIKKYKSSAFSTPRVVATISNKFLSKDKPCRHLTRRISGSGGRNNQGRKSVRSKRTAYRYQHRILQKHPITMINTLFSKATRDIEVNNIDKSNENFLSKMKIESTITKEAMKKILSSSNENYYIAEVLSLEKVPQKTGFMAKVRSEHGLVFYLPAEKSIASGSIIQIGIKTEQRPGNITSIENIANGTSICCIESQPGKGMDMVRSAGSHAILLHKELDKKQASIKLPSGSVRKISTSCIAMIGQVSNINNNCVKFGKAGKRFHLGYRPRTRARAMNSNDHPNAAKGHISCNKNGNNRHGVRTSTTRKRRPSLVLRRRS